MATTHDDLIATLQRANAELRRERDAALASHDSRYGEHAAHLAATIEVLKAMSASPGDPQPVFDLICRQARALLDGPGVGLFEYDGELVHLRAESGTSVVTDAAAFAARKRGFPMVPVRGSLTCRAILDAEIVHIRDLAAEPGIPQAVLDLGHRTQVSIPLMRDGRAIGAISAGSMQVDGISDSEIALLQTFAEQAVIAIGSAETYRALQTRTRDLQESLEYQTATGDVLKVISQSTFDLQPVLDTVAETAARLCDADQAAIYRREGESARLVANFGFPPEHEAYQRSRGAFPIDPNATAVGQRTLVEGRPVHVHDVAAVPGYWEIAITLGKQRTSLGVPLLREGETIGNIMLARQRVEPFTDRQIELVSTFADQAVIAIENTRLLTEQREALEQQIATAEVLQVINASPGNLAPVFDTMLEGALRLCDSAFGVLATYDGEVFHNVAFRGVTPELSEFLRKPARPGPGLALHRVLQGEDVVHIADIVDDVAYRSRIPGRRALADLGGARTQLLVALRKDDVLLGALLIFRQEVRPFTDKQIALLQTFAAQAVIAMENARLITEQREALEQQTATAEVLGVINASPGNLQPVFDAILEKAHLLCGIAAGSLEMYDGDRIHAVAVRGMSDSFSEQLRRGSPAADSPATRPLLAGERVSHVINAADVDYPVFQSAATQEHTGTVLFVPLRRDGTLLGMIASARHEVRPFSEKEIALLENFAAQAVIAIENARLLDEIRQRQAELRITFENMGDGVAMFDETPRLVAWNRRIQEMLDVPDDVLAERRTYADYIRYLAGRGEYGPDVDPEAQLRHFQQRAGEHYVFERTRSDGRVIEVRHNPVPGGGFVLIFADITARKRSEAEIRTARDAAEAAYRELKATQANLIQAEKMASLGQLTAGIAHEIKNPLNFVNNFASLSVDLLDELTQTAAPGFAMLDADRRADIDELAGTLAGNLQKINEHGRRADGIVRSMLEHSRGTSGERRSVDLNALIDEALNLAYHGARAQDQSFNITLERDFASHIAPIELTPQDMTRVLLNLFSNGFYAITRRARSESGSGYQPTLKVTTHDLGDAVEIRVRDNGIGIPTAIRDKLFQPFFTTKPTGEGTGLGLSISYDIVTKQHGGSITADSSVGEYSEFTVRLPRSRAIG